MATMQRYAMIHTQSGICVNVFDWDGDESKFLPPLGHTMIPDADYRGSPGLTWNGTEFVSPPNMVPQEQT